MKTDEILERQEKLITSNRKARHDFEIVNTIEAGIELKGTEVKSLRSGKANLQDAYGGYLHHDDDELYLFNFHINEYEQGNRENHKPKRARKLLIHKREAIKWKSAVNEKGLTIIPLKVYFSGHLIKVEIALVRAKKKFDKREATKKREQDREIRKKFKV